VTSIAITANRGSQLVHGWPASLIEQSAASLTLKHRHSPQNRDNEIGGLWVGNIFGELRWR